MDTIEQVLEDAFKKKLSDTFSLKQHKGSIIVNFYPIDRDGETVLGFPPLYVQKNDFFAITAVKEVPENLIEIEGKYLGDRLRFLRCNKMFSVTQVSEKLGRTTVTIANWERNHSEPTATDIRKLCKLYEVSPSRLLNF